MIMIISTYPVTGSTFDLSETHSLGPHDAYFRMRTLKPQVAKVLSSPPNWLVVIERAQLSYFSATFQ